MKVHFELAANFNKACFDLEIGPMDGRNTVDVLQEIYDMLARVETVDPKPTKPVVSARPQEEMASPKQINYLKGLGIRVDGPITKKEANKLIQANRID